MDNDSTRKNINRIAKIREAANLFIEQELQARGLKGIVPAHGSIFTFLFRQQQPVAISALVKDSGRAKSTVTGIVKTLERHGYLFRQDCPEDARSFRIGLTEQGWAIKGDFEEISEQLLNRFYGDMPQAEREQFSNLLVKIEKNMNG